MELLNEVQTFTRLGLTFNQARIYLTLVQLGNANAQEISKTSKITRPDVYRVIPTLESLGLVQKTLGTPAKFKPLSMENAIHLLMNGKMRETLELRDMAKAALRKARVYRPRQTPDENQPQFELIPSHKPNINKRLILLQTAKESIDVVTAIPKINSALLQEEISKALSRGVRIRVVINKPETADETSGVIDKFKRAGSFDYRFISGMPKAILSIYDRKDVLVSTSPITDVTESVLWCCNPGLVALIQEHFDVIWSASNRQDHPALAVAQ